MVSFMTCRNLALAVPITPSSSKSWVRRTAQSQGERSPEATTSKARTSLVLFNYLGHVLLLCCVSFFFSGGARHDQKNPTLLEGVVKVGECWWLTIFFEIFESNKPLSRILRGLNHHNYITITASSWLNIFGLPV